MCGTRAILVWSFWGDRAVVEGETGKPWTRGEVETAVAAYLHMLRLSLNGQVPNKAEHNRQLQRLLPARSEGSIERKHGNISAVLLELGVRPLRGYRPLFNYQRLLVEVVSEALLDDTRLDQAALREVETPAEQPLVDTFEDFIVEVPTVKAPVADTRREWIQRAPVKRDYLAREARNRSLGLAGELLAMEYEARRLHALGEKQLASKVEHVSRTQGDGAGYDILSFESGGRERFIEVKTTAFIAETPFFVSQNEVKFSDAHAHNYHLYRLFQFRDKPRMFTLSGAVAASCLLDPVTYRATLLGA